MNESHPSTNLEQDFLTAFDRHADGLFRHCFFRISDRERAQDLVQETFTRAWQYAVKGHTIEEYAPFLYRIMHNLIVDEYRKKHPVSLDAMLETEGVDEGNFDELVVDERESTIYQIDAKDALRLLEALPETYRQVVVLRFIDGLSPQEISKMIGQSENVVSVRIHRGMQRLQRIAKERSLM